MLVAEIDLMGLAAVIIAAGTAVSTVIGAFSLAMAAKAKAAADAAKVSSEKTGAAMAFVQEDIRKVEVATNSMKDALVMATEKEALARGTAEGIATGVAQEKERTK